MWFGVPDALLAFLSIRCLDSMSLCDIHSNLNYAIVPCHGTYHLYHRNVCGIIPSLYQLLCVVSLSRNMCGIIQFPTSSTVTTSEYVRYIRYILGICVGTSSEYRMYGIILSLRPRPCRPCPACLAIV